MVHGASTSSKNCSKSSFLVNSRLENRICLILMSAHLQTRPKESNAVVEWSLSINSSRISAGNAGSAGTRI